MINRAAEYDEEKIYPINILGSKSLTEDYNLPSPYYAQGGFVIVPKSEFAQVDCLIDYSVPDFSPRGPNIAANTTTRIGTTITTGMEDVLRSVDQKTLLDESFFNKIGSYSTTVKNIQEIAIDMGKGTLFSLLGPTVGTTKSSGIVPYEQDLTVELSSRSPTLSDDQMDLSQTGGTHVLRIRKRLEEIASLDHGWLDGHGRAPFLEEVGWLAEAFDLFFPSTILRPYLYPTESGDVQAEWSLKNREITLEVNLENHSGYWHELNLKTDIVIERTINLDDSAGWKWIVSRLKQDK